MGRRKKSRLFSNLASFGKASLTFGMGSAKLARKGIFKAKANSQRSGSPIRSSIYK